MLSSPLLVVAALGAALYFAASLRYPVAALCAFIALTFISEIAGVGSGVSVAKGLGGVLIVSWAYRQFARHSVGFGDAPGVRPFIAGAVALFAWMIISAAWSSDSHAAVTSGLRLLQGPLIALVIVATVDRIFAFRAVIGTYVAGATASALAGVAGVTKSDNATLVESGRLSGGIGDPNFLAAVLISALLITLFAFQVAKNRSSRRHPRPSGGHLSRRDLPDRVAWRRDRSRGGDCGRDRVRRPGSTADSHLDRRDGRCRCPLLLVRAAAVVPAPDDVHDERRHGTERSVDGCREGVQPASTRGCRRRQLHDR